MHFIFDLHRTLIYYPISHGHFLAELTDINPERFDRILKDILNEIEHSPSKQGLKMSLNGHKTESRSAWLEIFLDTLGRMNHTVTSQMKTYLSQSYERLQKPENWSIYDDVLPVLRLLLERNHSLGLLSNFDWRWKAIVDYHFSDISWSFVSISCLSGLLKPDTEVFRNYLTQIKLSSDQLLMVGDDLIQDGASQKIDIRYLQVLRPEKSLQVILNSWLNP